MSDARGRAFLPNLTSKNAQTRREAALELAVYGWTFAVPDLMRLAQSDPDPAVRIAAIHALGEIGDDAAYPLLQSIRQSSKEAPEIVQEAFDACDKLDGCSRLRAR